MINKLKTAYSNYALKIFFTLLASSVIYSCSNDDDPEDIHEHENITRVSIVCLLYTSPSPRDISGSRMPSSA